MTATEATNILARSGFSRKTGCDLPIWTDGQREVDVMENAYPDGPVAFRYRATPNVLFRWGGEVMPFNLSSGG